MRLLMIPWVGRGGDFEYMVGRVPGRLIRGILPESSCSLAKPSLSWSMLSLGLPPLDYKEFPPGLGSSLLFFLDGHGLAGDPQCGLNQLVYLLPWAVSTICWESNLYLISGSFPHGVTCEGRSREGLGGDFDVYEVLYMKDFKVS